MAQRQRCLALARSLCRNGQRQSALPDCLRTNGQRRAQTGTCFDAGKGQRQDTLHTAKALFIVKAEHLHRGGDLQSLFGRTHAAAYRIRADHMRDMRRSLDAFDGFGRKRLRLRAAVQAGTVLLGFQQGARQIKVSNAVQRMTAPQQDQCVRIHCAGQRMIGCDAAFQTAYRELRVGRILLDRSRQFEYLRKGCGFTDRADRLVKLHHQTPQSRLSAHDDAVAHRAAFSDMQRTGLLEKRKTVCFLDRDVLQNGERKKLRFVGQNRFTGLRKQFDMIVRNVFRVIAGCFVVAFGCQYKIGRNAQLAAVDDRGLDRAHTAFHQTDRAAVELRTFLDVREAERHLQTPQTAAVFRLVQNDRLNRA